jgi:uncharacterized protein (TIGR03790 family)
MSSVKSAVNILMHVAFSGCNLLRPARVVFAALTLTTCARAAPDVSPANPGDEVIIVYNTRVPASKEIAEHYADRRHVPAGQIFGFHLPAEEDISRADFRDHLQKPLADALEKKKLWHIASQTVPAISNQPAHTEMRVVRSKIRYAVLCYGVPLRIEHDASLHEPGTESLRPEMLRNEAAVDSELALLPVIEQNLPLAGPLRNPLYTTTNSARLHPTNALLMVTRLDGPSPAIARALVDKAMEAETNGLWGRAYFDLRNTTDPAMKMGEDWIRGASEICRHLGFETTVDENPATIPAGFPLSQIAIYIGWYAEHACGPFAQPTVEFMPGAFAYHLHSFSAVSIRTMTRWVGPLLAKGATITMGCVNEPYLAGTPDVATFTARLIFSGFTFGEAAYASQNVLSWQTTVVGDPLYRPFGRIPEELNADLERRHSKLVEWSYLRLANLNQANSKPLSSVAALIENLPATKQSAVLTEKLGDLYGALGKPSSAVHYYAQALGLDPSPQQRLRLLLTLGEKLPPLNREPEAYADYQKLVQDFPDYPDKTLIYRRLLALAKSLNQDSDVQKYQGLLDHQP